MKKIAYLFLTLFFAVMLSASVFAQNPPHPNGGSAPGSGNTPVGGGAPLGEGITIMLVAGISYALRKRTRLMQ
ncbi:MAG: hypothetical protein Kow00127_20350 [Bacteroidales bacterium]